MVPFDSCVLSPIEVSDFLDLLLFNCFLDFLVKIELMDMDCDQCLDFDSLKVRLDVFKTHLSKTLHDSFDFFEFFGKFLLFLSRSFFKTFFDYLSPNDLDTQ